MPDFVTPAIPINNSTSYPLLLITALGETTRPATGPGSSRAADGAASLPPSSGGACSSSTSSTRPSWAPSSAPFVGLVPPFHRAFFNSSDGGGVFTAWLTSALKSIGSLFVSLPVVVAGITLYCATKEARERDENPIKMPLGTTAYYMLFVRFVA
ncbi:hypothetical protein VTG60DRAFT_1325 [Thermothelomyces hinnuleus]